MSSAPRWTKHGPGEGACSALSMLDAYDYAKGSKPAIGPSESTVVERVPAALLKVRRGAVAGNARLMTMLADDADCPLHRSPSDW